MYVKMTSVREEQGGGIGFRVMEKRERHRTPKQWCASVCACLCECHNMWMRVCVGGVCERVVLCLQCMPVCCRNNQDNQNFCSPLLSYPSVATWESKAGVEVSNWPTCRSSAHTHARFDYTSLPPLRPFPALCHSLAPTTNPQECWF